MTKVTPVDPKDWNTTQTVLFFILLPAWIVMSILEHAVDLYGVMLAETKTKKE